jgi:Transposase DDE domain
MAIAGREARAVGGTGVVEEGWPELLAVVGSAVDLEASARASGALVRARRVKDGATLLRLALAYGGCGLSLRQAAAWAAAQGVAELSDVAVLGRLAGAAGWLEAVAGALLAARVAAPESGERRLRLVDGTAVCHPGADRTSWRLHVTFDPGAQRLVRLELTDGRGAERLSRFAWAAGDVAVADRYYARPRELRPVLEAGADLVVRTGWNSLRLLTPEGEPFGLSAALDAVGEGPVAHAVRVDERRPDGATLPLRLVAARLPADAAERARRRLRKDATKRGRTPDPRSLAAAGFVLLLTSLPAEGFPPARVLALYRLRWQVELAFKRLKSLLGLGALPAESPGLARAWLNAKLVLALLAEDASDALAALSPSGGARGLALAPGPRRGAEPYCRRPGTAVAAPLARARRGLVAGARRAAPAPAEPGP